jgi:hypothetical protein
MIPVEVGPTYREYRAEAIRSAGQIQGAPKDHEAYRKVLLLFQLES